MSASIRSALMGLLLGCSAPPPSALSFDVQFTELPNAVVACTPGTEALCLCNSNTRGVRYCQPDQTYTACMCVDARVPCFAGAVQGCDCGNGVAGIQFCGEDGVFSGCMCPMTDLDAGTSEDIVDASTGADAIATPDQPPTDLGARDVAPDMPDVCACEEGTMRFCPLPPGQVEATYSHGPCRRGVQRCEGAACWGECVGRVDPRPESCNGVDDNCNGLVDDLVVSCGLGPCRRVVNTCVDGGTITCMPDYSIRRAETCNGVDDDCNGMVDDLCRDF